MNAWETEERFWNFIAGERRAPSDGQYIAHADPRTGEPAFEIPDSDFLDVVASVQASNKIAADWAKTTFEQRASLLLKLADRLQEAADEFARLESAETGAPLTAVRSETVADAIECFRVTARLLLDETAQGRLDAVSVQFSQRLSGGVTGLILPWGEALLALARKLAPALAAGNCVIVKPSTSASRGALRLAELAVEIGIPAGVINVVCGRGESVGEALVSHPAIPLLSFTGSTETGRVVFKGAAEHFKKLQMSLGGRNAVLVFGDCEIEKTAASVAVLAMPFHAATAWRGSRLFIQETIYKPFLDALKVAVEKLIVGDPTDATTRIGPFPTLELKKRFEAACVQAASEKGKALWDRSGDEGVVTNKSGFLMRPQIFFDLTLCSTLQQDEVVGPFMTASSFKYQHDAVKQANTSPLGQAAYIFTPSLSKAGKVATKIEAGDVFVNSGPQRDWRLSRSAPKGSGYGADGLVDLLDFFSRRTRVRLNF